VNEWKNIIGAASGDKENVLGKFLYFSLANVLVDKAEFSELCEDILGTPYTGGNRVTVSDAFRSATGDIRERLSVRDGSEQTIYEIYCRDNMKSDDGMCRELVKETLNQRTNQYRKLANIHYHKTDQSFSFDDLAPDADVDALAICRRAEELFDLYQRCANRRQVETVCLNFLRGLEATKVSVNGHLYFVPKHAMEQVDVFESFIAELNDHNRNDRRLTANSFYIIDDAKQREKMTEEFYIAVKKEIAQYQEKADYLIKSGSRSPSVLEHWVVKIANLEEKKRHYEEILRRELDGLDDEFGDLKLLSQELSVRAKGLRARQSAKAA